MSSKDTIKYAERKSIFQVEEQLELAPKFNEDGLLPVVTTCSKTSEVLMVGYMNEEALSLSILSGLLESFKEKYLAQRCNIRSNTTYYSNKN
jgi:phosphoribosyl-AMP cyclohydrolase